MNQNDFGGIVFPAMAGFFLFGKRAKVQAIQQEKPDQLPAIVSQQTHGLTGVARYLLAAPAVSSVTKYVKKSEKQQLSGVAKYVLRQAIAEKNAPKPSGVSQYVAKVAKEPLPRKKSGVENYIAKQEKALRNAPLLTGVARYEVNQNLIARKLAALELIKKYREAEEEAKKLAKEAAVEAEYEASKAMLSDEQTSQVGETPATRVGRYLKQQESSSTAVKATGVARYLARQIIIDSQKPVLSKVAKYLQEQSLATSKKPALTGVAKYLSKQHATVNKPKTAKEAIAESKVSRYIAAQEAIESNKPVLSGVSKYLERQVHLEADKKVAIETELELMAPESEKCLEGEFIPANEFEAKNLTGVSKYLEKQNTVVTAAKEIAKERITGVSRYVDKQVEAVKETLAVAPLTGVDRYLLNRTS